MIAYYLLSNSPDSLELARAVLASLSPEPAVVVCAAPGPTGWPTEWIRIADSAPGTWQSWVLAHEPGTVVIDGSSEHVRLTVDPGRTVAVVAHPGGGSHGELGPAYGIADLILAPWPEGALEDGWPAAWRERTVHLGAASWTAQQMRARAQGAPSAGRATSGGGLCLRLVPSAGGPDPRERRDLLIETPNWRWWFAVERELHADGPVWDVLSRSDAVVCAPTPGNLAALVAARKPAVLVAPDRPSASQRFLAHLTSVSAPVIVTDVASAAGRWRELLSGAAGLDGRAWDAWCPQDRLRRLPALLGVGATTTTGQATPSLVTGN